MSSLFELIKWQRDHAQSWASSQHKSWHKECAHAFFTVCLEQEFRLWGKFKMYGLRCLATTLLTFSIYVLVWWAPFSFDSSLVTSVKQKKKKQKTCWYSEIRSGCEENGHKHSGEDVGGCQNGFEVHKKKLVDSKKIIRELAWKPPDLAFSFRPHYDFIHRLSE